VFFEEPSDARQTNNFMGDVQKFNCYNVDVCCMVVVFAAVVVSSKSLAKCSQPQPQLEPHCISVPTLSEIFMIFPLTPSRSPAIWYTYLSASLEFYAFVRPHFGLRRHQK